MTIGTIIWKRYPDDRKRPGRLNDLDRLDRIEFYPDDRVNFEAIIWKRSQTTESIGTIEGYPRRHRSYLKNGGRKHRVKHFALYGRSAKISRNYLQQIF